MTADTLQNEYFATTDAATVLNLTDHSYFNLAGDGKGNILNHVLTILADRFTRLNAEFIPTGEFVPVAHTPFDFKEATSVEKRIPQGNGQLHFSEMARACFKNIF